MSSLKNFMSWGWQRFSTRNCQFHYRGTTGVSRQYPTTTRASPFIL